MKWIAEPLSRNVHRFKFPSLKSSDVIPSLIISDIHYDSPYCEREMLKAHLDEIKDAGGIVIIVGDWFDVMGTYGDKRIKREEVDPRYIIKGRSYLDVVCDDTVEFLKPYAENILLFGYGNHETTILKYHDTDPIRRVVAMLNTEPKANIQLGAYMGYIILTGIYRYKDNYNSYSCTVNYLHGTGTKAKRSKGMLDVQLEVMKHPHADLLVRGDSHQKWYDPSSVRWQLSRNGKLTQEAAYYLLLGSYKNELKGANGFGYVTEKNYFPAKMGGWFVDFLFKNGEGFKIRPIEAL